MGQIISVASANIDFSDGPPFIVIKDPDFDKIVKTDPDAAARGLKESGFRPVPAGAITLDKNGNARIADQELFDAVKAKVARSSERQDIAIDVNIICFKWEF